MKVFAEFLSGGVAQQIEQIMRYSGNILLGIILALIFNYFQIRMLSKNPPATVSEIKKSYQISRQISNFSAELTNTTTTYSPQKSDNGLRSCGGGKSHHH